jgi:valyl-tRNA synthetase
MKQKGRIEKSYKDFKLSEALKTIYSLIWDDFLQLVFGMGKTRFEQPIEKNVYKRL